MYVFRSVQKLNSSVGKVQIVLLAAIYVYLWSCEY